MSTPRTAIAISEPRAKLLLGRAAFIAQAKAASLTPRPAGAISVTSAATYPIACAEPTSTTSSKGMKVTERATQ